MQATKKVLRINPSFGLLILMRAARSGSRLHVGTADCLIPTVKKSDHATTTHPYSTRDPFALNDQ